MRQYAAPKTEQDFERFCLEFLRRLWKRPNLDLYAKRGEGQSGVDIIDTTNAIDLWAAQCKLHEPWKTLPPAEITAEVEKAKAFPFALSYYAICTTARKTGPAQDRVIEINAEHQVAGLFTVRVIYWEEMEAYLDQDQGLVDILGSNTNASVRRVVREENEALGAQFALLLSQVQPVLEAAVTGVDVELDRAKGLLERHERRVAETLLLDLKARAADRFTPLQAFRCFSMLAAIAFNRGAYAEAADLFTKAHAAHPEHERATANLAHAEFLLGRPDRAWERAQEAFKTHPRNAHVAAVYVALAPESVTVETLIAALSETVLGQPEVIWAIANRYLLADRLDEAMHWARRVAEDVECGLNALGVLGQALLKAGLHGDRTPSDAAELLSEAATVFERAAIRAEAEGEHHVAIHARLLQLDATDATADANAFEAIIEHGLRIAGGAPKARSRFLLARAGMYQQQGDFARAARDAEKAVALHRSADARAMYATCLWNRNAGTDRVMARREMARLLDEAPAELVEQCTDFMVRTCLIDKLWTQAESAVKTAEGRGLDAATALAFRAEVARGSAAPPLPDPPTPRSSQRASASFGTRSRGASTRRRGQIVGRHQAGSPLEPLASHSELTDETRTLIHCALRAERHDLLLQFCEDLRKAGVHERRLLQIELGCLEKYAPAKAVEVIEALIVRMPDEHTLRVRRAVLGTRLKRANLAVFTPGDAPPQTRSRSSSSRRPWSVWSETASTRRP